MITCLPLRAEVAERLSAMGWLPRLAAAPPPPLAASNGMAASAEVQERSRGSILRTLGYLPQTRKAPTPRRFPRFLSAMRDECGTRSDSQVAQFSTTFETGTIASRSTGRRTCSQDPKPLNPEHRLVSSVRGFVIADRRVLAAHAVARRVLTVTARALLNAAPPRVDLANPHAAIPALGRRCGRPPPIGQAGAW